MDTFYRSLRAIPYRRGPNRWVAGICGGLSAKYGWDPALVRLVVLLSFILPFIGVGTYLVAWILLPWQDGSIPLERVFPGRNSPNGVNYR